MTYSTQADGLSLDWHVLDGRPTTTTDPGAQREVSCVSPAFWKDFRNRLCVLQNTFKYVNFQANLFLVTEHNVEHVAEAFHRVIVGPESSS